jgi:hypothetical protein
MILESMRAEGVVWQGKVRGKTVLLGDDSSRRLSMVLPFPFSHIESLEIEFASNPGCLGSP